MVVLVVVLAVDYVEMLVPNNHYVMVIVNVILVVPNDVFRAVPFPLRIHQVLLLLMLILLLIDVVGAVAVAVAAVNSAVAAAAAAAV